MAKKPHIDATIQERHARWIFTFSAGKPRAHAKLGNGPNGEKLTWESVDGISGFRHLLPYMDKDFAAPLLSLNKAQFLTLLTAIHDGDGTKIETAPSCDWTPRSWTVCSARKWFVERLQMLATIHGMTGNLRWERANRKNPIAILTITPKNWRSVGGVGNRPQIQVSQPTDEEVWCVETETGTIITRRRGKVTVMGNCQMLGRGTRKADGKENCLVLDFANNIMTHGPVDSVRVRTKKKGGECDAEAPTKICPSCDSYMPAAIHQCTHCGHEWPIDEEPKHVATADIEAPVLTSEITKKWLPVKVRMHDRNTGKNGKPDSVRVEYMCGFANYREFICPEHTGFASAKAGQWWRAMGGSAPPPKTVSDMLRRMDERELMEVEQIMVIPDGKYMRVSGYWLQDGTEIDHKLRVK